MALIQIVNVSTPNDGLGDPLRVSQVKANDNFSELNDKKVEKIAGFDLSENNFTDTEKAKLAGIQPNAEVNVQANWNQTDPSADDYIIGKPTNGKIITFGTYSLLGQDLTINAGWVWQINDILYTNTSAIVINFPYTSTGTQRLDLVVFNTLNSAERVEGDESISSPIAPLQIPDSVLFSVSLISESTVGAPVTPTPTGMPKIQFTADGVSATYDIGVIHKIVAVFWNSVLLDDVDWTQSNTTFTLTFIPANGDKIKPI